ncbi:hypothetical protein L0M92_15095, partial [Casaltella massiliensis]|nr:hypothetical protein [Casaltella massiliensis]
MARVNCSIKKENQSVYKGDLVTYKGNLGLVCEVRDGSKETYCIMSFDGNTLKNYGDAYSEIDYDNDVTL